MQRKMKREYLNAPKTIEDVLRDEGLENFKRVEYKDPVTDETLHGTIRDHQNLSNMYEMGFFGNIWVRSHFLRKAGDTNGGGHYHHFDHVSLLISGKVLVEVEGFEPKEFTAPRFIIIDKDHKHKFTALEDDTVYYCVFALRNHAGQYTDMYTGDNSPYSKKADHVFEQEQMKKILELESKTVHTDR